MDRSGLFADFALLAATARSMSPITHTRAVSLWFGISKSKVVEQSDTIGFGPHAYAPGPGDVLIVGVDVHLTVERNTDSRTGELYA